LFNYIPLANTISFNLYSVPKGGQISELSLGVYRGASLLAGKFPKMIKPTSLWKFPNAILPASHQKFLKNRRRQKKGVTAREPLVPDRSRSLEVVIVGRINNLGAGNLEWGGMRRG
jgi:hypothetical protein